MSISIINKIPSGGLKPELIVQAPAQSTIDIIQNNIIINTYTLGASETTHTFVVKLGTYTVQRTLDTTTTSTEVIVDTVKQYTVNLKGEELKSLSEGSIVYLNENGVATPFYVAKHNYESKLNGEGRTLLVRQFCETQQAWGTYSSDENPFWSTASIKTWLNDIYKLQLDPIIQTAISSTKYYYYSSWIATSPTTRSDSVFLLSIAEIRPNSWGHDTIVPYADGSALPNYDIIGDSRTPSGAYARQWTRSPWVRQSSSSSGLASSVGTFMWSGNYGRPYLIFYKPTDTYYARPCFTLPDTILVDDNNHIIAS